MKDHAKAMVLSSFIADSLSLCAHWIYDTDLIVKSFGRIEEFKKPDNTSYHSTRNKGDFTHYGDQTLLLMKSIKDFKGFDMSRFSHKWRALFTTYDGYMDHATKTTLKNLDKGDSIDSAGSKSGDLGGASRIAPLVYIYSKDLNGLILSARMQTAMTHNNPLVKAAADFFARITYSVLHGLKPSQAIDKTTAEHVKSDEIKAWVGQGGKSIGTDTISTIKEFGQMCRISAAFPSVIHLILKYENDLKSALIENVMAGGDSSARGMIAGMVLGAHLGTSAIPEKWKYEMNHLNVIESFLT